jgi:hypothetical protein
MPGDAPRHELQLPPSRSDEATQDWFAAAQRIGRDVDLDTSAHTLGAMLRRRGVPAATNLLCLALMYGPGRMPLRMIAERADAHGIAHVSEPALLRRLCNAADWLTHVADQMMANRLEEHGRATLPDAVAPDAVAPDVVAAPMLSFAGTAQMMPGLPAATRLTAQMLGQLAGPTRRDRRDQMIAAARGFIVDFNPWPADLFSDPQIHWLLCVRWTFVSAHLRDVPPGRPEADPAASPVLSRSRQQAHLLAALVSADTNGRDR